MKFLILIYFSISTCFGFFYNESPIENDKNHPQAKNNFFFEPTILFLTPFKKPSIPEMDYFKSKLVNYSLDYIKDAAERGRNRPNPISKFVFIFQTYFETELDGHCDYMNNVIYLKLEYFNKSLFYHELGHCDLGYSHVSDYNNVINKGHSTKIMHWFYRYPEPREKDLDIFFNSYHNHRIDSRAGFRVHQKMLNEIEIANKKHNKK